MTDTGIVKIHNKEYQTVALRVQMFREKFPEYGLRTRILESSPEFVVMVAEIWKEGFLLATGHAEEKRGSTQINKTSALENCETSAIGRALAAMGLGGTEFASANEVQNAIRQQKEPDGNGSTPITEQQAIKLMDMAEAAPGGIAKFENYLANLNPPIPAINKIPATAFETFHKILEKAHPKANR